MVKLMENNASGTGSAGKAYRRFTSVSAREIQISFTGISKIINKSLTLNFIATSI
jgi:hypothetical protein